MAQCQNECVLLGNCTFIQLALPTGDCGIFIRELSDFNIQFDQNIVFSFKYLKDDRTRVAPKVYSEHNACESFQGIVDPDYPFQFTFKTDNIFERENSFVCLCFIEPTTKPCELDTCFRQGDALLKVEVTDSGIVDDRLGGVVYELCAGASCEDQRHVCEKVEKKVSPSTDRVVLQITQNIQAQAQFMSGTMLVAGKNIELSPMLKHRNFQRHLLGFTLYF